MAENLGRGREVTIIGAGFSGLTSAFYLARAGFRVRVIEKAAQAGGLLGTHEHRHGLVETAANAVLNSALVQELFDATGVPLIGTLESSRKRYIFARGKPRRWPIGLAGTLQLLAFIFRYIFARAQLEPRAGESAREWGERTLGVMTTRYGIEAGLQGIYAGNPAQMSARLIFGRIVGKKIASTPAKLRVRGSVSAPGGMGELVSGLRNHLIRQGVEFQFEKEFASEWPSHPTVLATSSDAAARLLKEQSPQRAELLNQIELLPVVSTTVFFREPLPRYQGFGCLFPPIEKRRALGVLMNSFIFKGRAEAAASETWIIGGALNPQAASRTDQEILDLIREERASCFGDQGELLDFRITRWPKALPHYTVKLEEILPKLQEPEKNTFLIGNYLGEIGLSRILERAAKLPAAIAEKGKW